MLHTVCSVLLALPVAGDVRIEPAQVTLTGPKAAQRLLVLETKSGEVVGDRTRKAKFTSSNPQVASVDDAGRVRAVGDGEAVIIATDGSTRASANVRVEKTREPFEWRFATHVEPLLTRLGCNSGACHGALAGKGGFKLSLRAYDPTTDYFNIVKQDGGRRVELAEPARSLVLTKPSGAISHKGGVRFATDSLEYR